jgi:acyl-CoA synthetase (AMP-forming)/AMP-acid ligase II
VTRKKFVECPVRRGALKFPSKLAVYAADYQLSYAELDALVEEAYSCTNIGHTDAALLVPLNPSLGVIIKVLAGLRSGSKVVLLNPRFGSTLHQQQCELADVDYKRTIFDFELTKEVKKQEQTALLNSHTLYWDCNARIVLFTSGSEGEPKGVLHSSLTISNHLARSVAAISLDAACCWLSSLPYFHVGGLLIPLRCWWAGASVYIPSSLNRADLLQLIDKHPNFTHASFIPQMLEEMLNYSGADATLRILKLILLGGTSLSESLIAKALQAKLPVWIGYGSSELCSHVTLGKVSKNNFYAGKLLKDVDVVILDETGNALNEDQIGSIAIKYPGLFLGYCGKPLRDDGELFLTSDRGYLSEQNELFVIGRADRVIISGGEKIDPYEIERVLPELRCVALGFPHPKWGARPVLFIESFDAVLPEWILERLTAKLPPLLRPDLVYLVPQLATNPTEKIAYAKLIHRYAQTVALAFTT